MPQKLGHKDPTRMIMIRRILQYTPAVVLGMLVVAWILTQGGWMQFVSGNFVLGLQHGSITGYWQESDRIFFVGDFRQEWWFDNAPTLGNLRLADARSLSSTGNSFPIPLLATIILPLAIGPFISFRFRLWHFFAYTALLAVEIAYYLRWQE